MDLNWIGFRFVFISFAKRVYELHSMSGYVFGRLRCFASAIYRMKFWRMTRSADGCVCVFFAWTGASLIPFIRFSNATHTHIFPLQYHFNRCILFAAMKESGIFVQHQSKPSTLSLSEWKRGKWEVCMLFITHNNQHHNYKPNATYLFSSFRNETKKTIPASGCSVSGKKARACLFQVPQSRD